ncbi:hypothetical protein BMETH_978_1 [methanotrophic bacterial endosymbiont of Bathymodiolus sp.]|nr:hypothetical protein BMETH_978_1 [methanotrophic bacterial endosymbiont of Bathymodiolus sp.]
MSGKLLLICIAFNSSNSMRKFLYSASLVKFLLSHC